MNKSIASAYGSTFAERTRPTQAQVEYAARLRAVADAAKAAGYVGQPFAEDPLS